MAERRHELGQAETLTLFVLQLTSAQGSDDELALPPLEVENALLDSMLDGQLVDIDLASLAQPMPTVERVILFVARSGRRLIEKVISTDL